MKVCRDCNEEFDAKLPHNKVGYVDQCGECARDVPRYVGRADASAKSGAGVHIFRSASAIAIATAVCKSENRAGFNANLGLGSTASTFGESHDI